MPREGEVIRVRTRGRAGDRRERLSRATVPDAPRVRREWARHFSGARLAWRLLVGAIPLAMVFERARLSLHRLRSRVRDGGHDASGQARSADSRDSAPDAEDDLDGIELPGRDWTVDAEDSVPPWRRADRARLDAARAAGSTDRPTEASASAAASLAREIRRLADLHADGVISSEEFVQGVRSTLAE